MTTELTVLTLAALLQGLQFVMMSIPAIWNWALQKQPHLATPVALANRWSNWSATRPGG